MGVSNMNGDARPEADDLRHRRRELRRELARVRWWRRLVQARRDLSIGFLADAVRTDHLGLSDAWEAVVAEAPTAAELSSAVWPEGDTPSASSVEDLTALDARLESYERRVSDNLDAVTKRMVDALGSVRRESLVLGGEHG